MNKKINGIWVYIIIIIILMTLISMLVNGNGQNEALTYSQVVDLFENEQVKKFSTSGNLLTMELADGKTVRYELASFDLFYLDLGDLIKEQQNKGVLETYDYIAEKEIPWWVSFLPYLLLIGVVVLFWYFIIAKSGGDGTGGARGAMGFGRSKAKLVTEDNKKATFKDVAGADEEKAELQEIVEFLKSPAKFIEIGARIPKGVLLVGPPGTGKTLIARAVAGEAGVPFLTISGSDFVELYVGVGASRVRDLFEQAKKNAPAIVFIDEIDAVGRQRGAGLGGGHDEREQTLNQLLVEMDGFSENEGVIVMAATNRADILDPALLRPGRFDRHVYVGMPDIKGREEILKVHARNKKFEPEVNFGTIAGTTAGFTGADLENLLNEAALLAARRGKTKIGQSELDDAFIKVIMGTEKKSRVMSEKEKKLTAYHEAGHAVITKLLPSQDPVHQISIIPRGRAGGFTLSLPSEDKYYASKNEMLDEILVFLGGRVAEKIEIGDISTGASNDIERASEMARHMVMRYGMSDNIGPISYGSTTDEVFLGRDLAHSRNYSEETAAAIDREVKRIMVEAFDKTEKLLRDNYQRLQNVAEYLIRNETVSGEGFEKLFNLEQIPDAIKPPEIKEGIKEKPQAEPGAVPGVPNETITVSTDAKEQQDENK